MTEREEFEDVSKALASAISILAIASQDRTAMERFCTWCAHALREDHFSSNASRDLLFGMLKGVSDALDKLKLAEAETSGSN